VVVSSADVFWRAEGTLLNLSAVRPVAFFTWNAQSFAERWARRGAVALSALFRPFLYATNRVFATRVLHTLLRGISQDRLDLLGEEYFDYVLKPRLSQPSVDQLKQLIAQGHRIVLVSQGLDHVMRPLAHFLGVDRLVANRLEFRDGLATGRLLDPVIRPRGGLARLARRKVDGRIPRDKLARDLGLAGRPELLEVAIVPTERVFRTTHRTPVIFDSRRRLDYLSVRQSLAGRHILLIGTTGFIGKVWLVKLLGDVPDIGKVYLLIRRARSTSAQRRFEKIVEESPVFEAFHEQYGDRLPEFLGKRVEVIEGDVSKPSLGLDPEVCDRLTRTLDLVVNSSGLTDFNPDLRAAVTTNVQATRHIVNFLRRCDHAGLLHLSTCYVVGSRDGRVREELRPNYTPFGVAGFDVQAELDSLGELIKRVEAQSESVEVTEQLRRQALDRANGALPSAEALESHIRKNRLRWVRNELTEAGIRRAKQFGWPNTYTFTKSLAESVILARAADLPVAVVRPSIVETSTRDPFQGWNEGVNTSAPISHLLGTYFRQLPSNEKKRLDLIPVDLVCRGMTLIAAAIIQRVHAGVYQLATSDTNPCDMRRSVELTGLAHRKHYRAQNGFEHRLRARFDSIPVSKERYLRLSAPRQRQVIQAIQKLSSPLPLKRPPLAQFERGLDRVEKLIELYEPFILHNEQVFEAENIELLSQALPADERETFGYNAGNIDWWEYWINIHIPALRKWSYPLIEGRPLEARPRRHFRLPATASSAGEQGG
jgi:thioester reductase-like protein/phosphoserine phosphatase